MDLIDFINSERPDKFGWIVGTELDLVILLKDLRVPCIFVLRTVRFV